MANGTDAVLQGLLGAYSAQPSYTYAGGFTTPSMGEADTQFEQERRRRAAEADARDKAEIASRRQAAEAALAAGFRGATPTRAEGPGMEPTYTAVGKSPVEQMGEAKRAEELAKIQGPAEVEKIKQAGALAAQQQQFDIMQRLQRLARGESAEPPAAPPAGAPGVAPAGGTAAVADTGRLAVSGAAAPTIKPPVPETTWHDFFFGGPTAAKYGTFMDLVGALGTYGKYNLGALPMDHPMSKAIQASSFANLQQIEGTFPGIRGISTIQKKFAEHQASIGREAPAGSYARLKELNSMLDNLSGEIEQESNKIEMTPAGKLTLAHDPAAVQRARFVLNNTRKLMREAQGGMEQQYPGIGSGGQGGVIPSMPGADEWEQIR